MGSRAMVEPPVCHNSYPPIRHGNAITAKTVGFIVSDRIEQQHTFVVLAKTHYWEWRSASLFEMCYLGFRVPER
jgi:hypothetical protein